MGKVEEPEEKRIATPHPQSRACLMAGQWPFISATRPVTEEEFVIAILDS